MINEPHFLICPVHDQKVKLDIKFDKIKASPKDIGFTYRYRGFDCSLRLMGKHCPLVDCPLIEEKGLRRSIFE